LKFSLCDLHDLGFTGQPWTFDNKQSTGKDVKVKLDRAVASLNWTVWFPAASLQHISLSRYDYCPIFLDVENENKGRAHQHIDRYEMMWEPKDSLHEEVYITWEGGGAMQSLGDIRNTLKGVMSSLKKWSHEKNLGL
jgi:hypothetical protein